MQPDPTSMEPAQYGRSFADVYDDWYDDGSQDAAVRFVHELVPVGGSVFELGIGTGRLALPIAASGRRVEGLDASAEMLAVLADKTSPNSPPITTHEGDAGDPDAYPAATFDLVLAAFNLLFNLTAPNAQQRCLEAAARLLAPEGALVVEAFVPRSLERREVDLVTRSVTAEQVVLIATDAEPATGLVQGSHIELTDGSVRLRPWSIRTATPAAIDAMASAAGLQLTHRYENYERHPFVEGQSDHHVSVYRVNSPSSQDRT